VRVLGIDPGSRVTGWGLVEEHDAVLSHVASGTIPLAARSSIGARLATLHAECLRLVAAWTPAAVVLERAFVARNVQSALRLGEARGAVLAAVAAAGAVLHEYAPAEVKLATVGYGRADKTAMMRGVAARLGLVARTLRPDAADALALALCHLHRAPLLRRMAGALAVERARAERFT
jgi:crossover junction endodeoxyribonuclease RuvC